MNIDEYIEKYSKITEEQNLVEVIMCVPPRKLVDFKWQESGDSVHFKVNSKTMISFLNSKGYNNLVVLQNSSIDNKHPNGLTATWVFEYEQKQTKLKKRKRKPSSEE
jgi:hypothetical protein